MKRRQTEKRKFGGNEKHHIESGGRKNNIFGLEYSQAVPAGSSDRGKAQEQNYFKI
jgi:hypothetical protein